MSASPGPLRLGRLQSNQQLRRIGAILSTLDADYGGLKQQLLSAHESTKSALEEASTLLNQRRELEVKQDALATFNEHFVLVDDEIAALSSTTEPVDALFFDSLSKAKRINQDCQVLLGLEKQTLGSNLMEQTSRYINFGYQKLYKWTRREFKTLNLENQQMGTSIRQALRVLAERPSLFHSCLDSFAEARERILSDAFELALTGTASLGAADPSIKPIDLTAHDPLRYVGDMLAWIHSATVSEREALEILFIAEGEELAKGIRSGQNNEIWSFVDDASKESDFDARGALSDLVSHGVAGAARILQQRVAQVIQTNEEAVIAYKLTTLINFYHITYGSLLGKDSSLSRCVGDLEEEASCQFRSLMRDHIATLQGDFQHAPLDLGPPGFLLDALVQLESIVRTCETSLSSSENGGREIESVLAEAFEPFMSGCASVARSMEAPNDSIFLINCYLAAAKCLDSSDLTRPRASELREMMASETRQLVTSQHNFLCAESGLGSLMYGEGDDSVRMGVKLSREQLVLASQLLDEFLPSALMDALERLKHLQDSTLARGITTEAANLFCEDFEELEKMINRMDDEGAENDGPSLRSAFPRTTAEIRVLLS